MHIRIKRVRIGTRFLGIFILTLCMAMPAPTAAGNKHTGTVLRTPKAKAKTIIIAPPKTSAHSDLEPNDPPAIFVNNWYCTGSGLDLDRKYVEDLLMKIRSLADQLGVEYYVNDLKRTAKAYLGDEQKSADNFWGTQTGDTIKLNPAQGSSDSHAWGHCYTKSELEAYKREAIRWAKYILDVYLPKYFPTMK